MKTTSKQLTLHFTCPFEVYDVEWINLLREVDKLLSELGLNAVTATVIKDNEEHITENNI
jgi:hypothetical protein